MRTLNTIKITSIQQILNLNIAINKLNSYKNIQNAISILINKFLQKNPTQIPIKKCSKLCALDCS